MPAMPRPEGKAKKIAYKILGVPANMLSKPSPRMEAINRQLVYEETRRAR